MTDQMNDKSPFEGWTTLQEASRLVNRSDKVLRYWVRKGYIRCYEIAPKVRLVQLEEVKAYAEEHKSHNSHERD